MMLHLVTFGCGDDEERRSQLGEVVRGLSDNHREILKGVWVVESEHPATALRDRIGRHLMEGESVIVLLLAGHAAWRGFDTDAVDWLLKHL
jgi:hypothetical protein